MLVIGGGYVGVELSQAMRRLENMGKYGDRRDVPQVLIRETGERPARFSYAPRWNQRLSWRLIAIASLDSRPSAPVRGRPWPPSRLP
ncbi:MAG TPA: hypothetical protein VGZ91_05725 [Candidatus Sulfotelmatobacter sp.]|nr:hypothetical protein [Candidatus Sulfotelmatobacter sp.]